MNFQSEYHTRKSHAQMDCGGKLNASMISADLWEKYKQMRGDNLTKQMLHFVGTCDPRARPVLTPRTSFEKNLVEVH